MRMKASGGLPAAAAVEVVAADRLLRKDEVKAHQGPRILALSGAPNLPGLRQELEARLMDPALAAALAGLPRGTVLKLQLDASGQVLSAAFSQAFAGSAKAQALIQVWRLRTWTGRAGSLELSLG
jgi:hypothetical protein